MTQTRDTILAIDEGTTGVTVLLVGSDLQVVATASQDFEQHFPKSGWVEHDLNQIWEATLGALSQTLKLASKTIPNPEKTIRAIGITNQRETTCFWDRQTTTPLARAIVWQDRRTFEICEKLKAKGLEKKFQKTTGLLLDPYFSGTKMGWALKNWSEVGQAARRGSLCMGTIDSFMVAKLSAGGGKPAFVTDPSNASRTLVYGLQSHRWEKDLCKILGFDSKFLPEVLPSSGEFARTSGVPGLPDGIPISGILGDQQSALLGQACLDPGQAKSTYGTGAFVLMNTGTKPVRSGARLLTTVAWKLGSGPMVYALEGSAFVAGAAVQWMRDGLGFIRESHEIETLAQSVASSDGVVFVPALTGLGAPHWDPEARGLFSGLSRGTTRAHLARAVLEGIAFQITDILDSMAKDAGKPLKSLNVDGGAAANDLLMQFQSDVLGVRLVRPKNLETTSLGAVFAAGLGVGIWKSPQEIRKVWKEDRAFDPRLSKKERTETLKGWKTAVNRAKLHG